MTKYIQSLVLTECFDFAINLTLLFCMIHSLVDLTAFFLTPFRSVFKCHLSKGASLTILIPAPPPPSPPLQLPPFSPYLLYFSPQQLSSHHVHTHFIFKHCCNFKLLAFIFKTTDWAHMNSIQDQDSSCRLEHHVSSFKWYKGNEEKELRDQLKGHTPQMQKIRAHQTTGNTCLIVTWSSCLCQGSNITAEKAGSVRAKVYR